MTGAPATRPSGLSLKWKVSAALALLLVFNSAFFVVGARAIAEMNGLVTDLYDRVVMSSTYAQMVRSDFLRFNRAVTSILTEDRADVIAAAREEMTEHANSFRDDLEVVRERVLNSTEIARIDAIQSEFVSLKRAAKTRVAAAATDPASTLTRLRAWNRDSARQKLLSLISDLTDRIVADGYAYRVAANERTAVIRRLTIAGSLGVLLFDVICMAFILFAILPPLRQLTAVCVDIANGHFGQRVTLRSRDEFGRLADAFNVMLEALKRGEDRIQDQLVTTNAMIDGLGQGFFIFDRAGTCQAVYSKSCLDVLERAPAGLPARDVLGVAATDAADFADWLDVVFMDVGTFADMAALGPATYPHSGGRTVALEYKAMRDRRGELRGILVVATDRTAEVRARTDADHEQEFSAMIGKLFRNRGDFIRFVAESSRMIDQLVGAAAPTVLRTLHTLKGGAATFAMRALRDEAHAAESAIATIDPRDANRLRAEITAVRDRLRERHAATLAELEAHCGFGLTEDQLAREVPVERLDRFLGALTADARVPVAVAERFRREFVFEPIGSLLRGYADVVRETAERLGKRVRPLEIVGGDVPVPRARVAPALAPLIHVFRNAVDHGIESPDERARAGKPAEAAMTVTITRAEADGRSWLSLVIADDGRGIDVAKLRAKLDSRGLDVTTLDDHAVLQHVFDAGVSTADAVTDLSGRGIGLDAVRAAAEAVGGKAWIDSDPGRGTRVTVNIPDPTIEMKDV